MEAAAVRLPDTDASVKGLRQGSAPIGNACWWEQHYFITLLCGGGRVNLKQWRSNEKKYFVVEKLMTKWALPDDAWIGGNSSASGHIHRWTRVSTLFLIVWLLGRLRARMRRGGELANHAERTWHALTGAQKRGQGLLVGPVVTIRWANGFTLDLGCAQGRLVGIDALLENEPAVQGTFDRLRGNFPLLRRGSLNDLSWSSWVFFLYMWHEEEGGRLKPEWLEAAVKECAGHMSRHIGRWVQYVVADNPAPRWDQGNALMDNRTRSGRRRSVDSLMFTYIGDASGRIRGSANTIAQAVVGRGTHAAQTLMHFTNQAYSEGLQRVFENADAYCINFDPGSYSGYQWNLGMVYSPRQDVAASLYPRWLGRCKARNDLNRAL